jgi:hypothetical protein
VGKFFEGSGAAAAASAETTVAPVASNVLKTDQGYVITVTVAPEADAKLASLEDSTAIVVK